MIFKLPSADTNSDCVRNSAKEDLTIIKNWLKTEPHLPSNWDDVILMNFLCNCHFSLEKTKSKIDKYFTMKTALNEFFTECDTNSPEIQGCLKLVQIATMPKPTPEGYLINIGRITAGESENFDFNIAIKILAMSSQVYLKIEEIGITGQIYVLDVKGLTFKHFLQITPSLAKKYFQFVHEALPFKIKEIHLINVTPFASSFIKFLSPFLKEKIRNRIFVHLDIESLCKFVPRDVLPKEFGGSEENLQKYMDELLEVCEEHRFWFKEQESLKADELKRLGKSTCNQEIFGVDGSFRQLSID